MSCKKPRPFNSKFNSHGSNIAARRSKAGSRRSPARQTRSLRNLSNRRRTKTHLRLRLARQYSWNAKRTYGSRVEKREDSKDSNRYRDHSTTRNRRYPRETNYPKRRNEPSHSSTNRDRFSRTDRRNRFKGNDSSFEPRIQRRRRPEREGHRTQRGLSNDQSNTRLSHVEGERRNSSISGDNRPSEEENQNPRQEINDVHGSDDRCNENGEQLEGERKYDIPTGNSAIAGTQHPPRFGPGPYFGPRPWLVVPPLYAPRHLLGLPRLQQIRMWQTYLHYGYWPPCRLPYGAGLAGYPMTPRFPPPRAFVPTHYL